MRIARWVLPWVLGAALLGCGAANTSRPEQPEFDVVVVGAGLGGLTAGARLATAGFEVLVLEQNYKVGGCTSSFTRGEFRFDAALHQLALGGDGIVRDILNETGVLDRIELIPAPELARSMFPGFDFTTPASKRETIAALKERWPEEADDIDAFFQLAEQTASEMNDLRELYRANAFSEAMTKLLVPVRQPNLFKWRNATLADMFEVYFDDPDLEAVISQYWLYFGPPPSKVWGPMFLAAYHSYLEHGAWQIRGSSQALSDALASRITELGGTVRTGVRVTGISVDGGVARGVTTATGEQISARYVVSNADPFQTFHTLVGKEKSPAEILQRIDELDPSNSLVGVYLGLDVTAVRWDIDEYEIFYNTSRDFDAMYQAMMEGRFEAGAVSLTFYSNLGDEFYAPEGKSVLVLNSYSSADYWPDPGPDYQARKAKMQDELIAVAERVLPGLSDHIVVKVGMTPRTIYTLTSHTGGVPYGWDLVPEHHERLGNETPLEGLYLAGSWAGMVHGASGAMMSGSNAARLIMDEEGLD